MLIPAPVHRLALRVGNVLRIGWWRLARPHVHGVSVIARDEAGRGLAQYGKVAPVNSVMRVIYAETAATGQGVTEAGDQKAAQEARDLWAYVQGLLNG